MHAPHLLWTLVSAVHRPPDCRRHLNFISGENGSGKSATLQCLQVCLGVDPRRTGRAQTTRGLIRDGATSAVARVTVWNTVRGCRTCLVCVCMCKFACLSHCSSPCIGLRGVGSSDTHICQYVQSLRQLDRQRHVSMLATERVHLPNQRVVPCSSGCGGLHAGAVRPHAHHHAHLQAQRGQDVLHEQLLPGRARRQGAPLLACCLVLLF